MNLERRRVGGWVLALWGAVWLAACAGKPVSPTLVALPPVAGGAHSSSLGMTPGTTAPPEGAGGPVLVLRRLAIPEYLQTRAVRYRMDDTRLAAWPQAAWAERLEVALTRSLAQSLRVALPGWTVCDTSCGDVRATHTLSLELPVLDYYAGSAGPTRLDLQARWVLANAATLPPVAGTWSASTPGVAASAVSGDTVPAQAQAQAYGQALADLARALARRLMEARP